MLVDAPMPTLAAAQAMAPAAEEAASQPAARAIQKLVLVIFWLLIMEGALRKWVAPGFSHILFFVRDPFVLLVYWYALRGGLFKGSGPFLTVGLIFAALAPLLALAQISSIGDSRMGAVAVYGWRQYFLYLPLPFVIARALNQQFLWKFARHVFLATILTAPLMFVQFHSSPASVINRGAAEDEALQFKSFDLLGDRIRPSGFFTSTVGVGNLVPSAFALLLGAWLTPAIRRGVKTPILLLTAAAIASCLAQSGSRGAFVATALVVLASLFVGLLIPDGGTRTRALVIPGVLLGVGAVLYPILFPEAFATMLARATTSDTFGTGVGQYGIIGRALYETIDFVSLMGDAPLVGYGLGLGGNGRTFLGTESDFLLQNAYAESDWARHIIDLGPLLGVLFILYRIALTFDLFRRTVQATVRARDPVPLLLFGYVGIGVFYGQLTGHGTVGGFLWLFLGVTLASCRIAMERSERVAPR
jgi:hypothetical protein